MNPLSRNSIWLLLVLLLTACADGQKGKREQAVNLPSGVCTPPNTSGSPWHVRNLYDCKTRSYFIPYQLWTGVRWDGDKGADCAHEANNFADVQSGTRAKIRGPEKWSDPITVKLHLVWEKFYLGQSRVEFYACHNSGIGRVYDSDGSPYLPFGGCSFPAGPGWKILARRKCVNSAVEITDIAFDNQNILSQITYRAWENGRPRGVCRYAPNLGMIDYWKR